MPDNVNPLETVEEHNAAVIAQQAAQDISGKSNASKPGDFEEANTALDKLVAQAEKASVAPAPDPEAEAKKAAAEAEAQKAAAEAEAQKAKEAEARKAADDFFKEQPQLPEESKPKSREAFDAIKAKAVQEIQAREAQIETLTKKISELEQRINTPSTEQMEKDKQLEEMKLWRAKLDVDFDPKFKHFDHQINEARDFIYAQLKQNPVVTPELLEKIKAFGGPENTTMTKLFEAANDPALQRIVESKVADIKMLQYQREQALKSTKDNVADYLKERESAFTKAASAHTENTQNSLNQMLHTFEWMKEKPAGTDDASKKAATEYNTFLTELKGELADALRDDSPQMRAILMAGYAKMRNLQRVSDTQATEITTLKTQLQEANTKLEGIKKSATTRLRESGASATGLPATPKASSQFTTPATDALDSLARQVMEERAAKGK
jgi:hypothetical protein